MLTLHLEAETLEGLTQKAAEALGGIFASPVVETRNVEAAISAEAIAPRRGRPPKDVAAPVAAVEEAPATEAIGEPVVETSEVDGEKISWDYNTEIKPAVLRVSQKGGRPMVEALLLPFKVTNANQIPPEQHAELMAAIDTLLAA